MNMGQDGSAIETIEIARPMDAIQARFARPSVNSAAVIPTPCETAVPEVLAPAERHRLMDETAERLSRQYTGWPINWPTVDAINQKIGTTFDRASLLPLLAEYAAEILKGGPAP